MEDIIEVLVEILGYILFFIGIVLIVLIISLAITIAGIILIVKGNKKQDKKMRNRGIVCLGVGIVFLSAIGVVSITFGTTA